MAIHFHVIIWVYFGILPIRKHERAGWQRPESRPIDLLEKLLAGRIQFPELLLVCFGQEFAYRIVQFGKTEEGSVP